MSKGKEKKKLKQIARQQDEEASKTGGRSSLLLNAVEKQAMSADDDDRSLAFVALKYFNHQHQCLSDWTPDELKAFSAFNEKVRSLPWTEIFKSGGKSGTKIGLGYTQLGNEVIGRLPHTPHLQKISKDIQFFELRVTGKARAIGFRIKAIFFLVWLDRGHKASA